MLQNSKESETVIVYTPEIQFEEKLTFSKKKEIIKKLESYLETIVYQV